MYRDFSAFTSFSINQPVADFQGLFVFFEFFDKLSDFSAFTSFSINQPVADFQGLFVFFEFFDKLLAIVM